MTEIKKIEFNEVNLERLKFYYEQLKKEKGDNERK